MVNKIHVVIVGGGFSGIYTIKKLLKNRNISITLIDPKNYFIFSPLLCEVATGNLDSDDIIFEYISFFNNNRFNFELSKLKNVNFKKNNITLENKKIINFDYLVFATGTESITNLISGSSQNALFLKNIDDAKNIKRKIINLYDNQNTISINLIGAGPTGIELAFEINEFLKGLNKDNLNFSYHINLHQRGDNILEQYNLKTQEYVKKELYKNNINLYLNSNVTQINKNYIILNNNQIKSDLTIVNIGVKSTVNYLDSKYLTESKNIIVENTLKLRDFNNIFAIGDIISINNLNIPKLAQTAIIESDYLVKNITNSIKNKELIQIKEIKLKGILLSLGNRKAISETSFIIFRGKFAWFLWRSIYLFKIPKFRNKLKIAFSWSIKLFSKRNKIIS